MKIYTKFLLSYFVNMFLDTATLSLDVRSALITIYGQKEPT